MNKKIIYIGCAVLSMMGGIAQAQATLQKDSLVNVAFGQMALEDVTQAVSTVQTADLQNYSVGNNGLTGMVGGYNGNIWGQGFLVLVDGVPRSMSNIRITEIENISVLKDAAAVVLYGSRAAKGVVLVTTKRGKNAPMRMSVRGGVDFNLPKSYPKYLDADCYMTLYNEACRNDGIVEKYDAATIYNTMKGTNPYRYPDIDFYSSDYLRKAQTTSSATGEVYGGNEKTQYYLDFGMKYSNSIVKYGESNKAYGLNFNVRGNVDMTLASWLKASTNAAVVYSNNYAGRGDFFGAASKLRPNWFSPLLPIDQMDTNVDVIDQYIQNSNHLIDGKYLLGGTSADATNAFADLLAAGYTKNKNRTMMFDVALKADLASLLKGLSFRTAFSVDYNSSYSETYAQDYAVYQPTWSKVDGEDLIVNLTKFGEDKKKPNETITKSTYDQTMTLSAQFDYLRTFAQHHNVSVTLMGWGYQTQESADAENDGSQYHRTSNINLGLRAAYNYNHKYYVDFSDAYVHSAKLPEGKRGALSPSVTLGWRISKEDFFKNNVSFVDDLRFTASYANLHQDLDISSYYLYKGYFSDKGGYYQWHDGVAGGNTTGSIRGDNPNLTFITREEMRVGLDATLFNKLIKINANYFINTTRGLLTRGASTIFPSFFDLGSSLSFLPWLNYNEDRRQGVDLTLEGNKKFGNLETTLGFNGMVLSTEALKRDEVSEYDYLLSTGTSLNSVRGYVCEGIFQNDEEIKAHERQTFGTVKPGDLKYKDINGDGVIDSKDQIVLGKGTAPFNFGLYLKLKYKNFTFFATGNGQTGAIGMKNNSYYWNRGTSKFSEIVWNRWTPERADRATYPRLTTGNGDNNYRNSTFWQYSTNVFRINNMQFTYDLPAKTFGNSFVKGLSLYAGSNNLFTISKEREYMDMSTGYPKMTNVYVGFKANL